MFRKFINFYSISRTAATCGLAITYTEFLQRQRESSLVAQLKAGSHKVKTEKADLLEKVDIQQKGLIAEQTKTAIVAKTDINETSLEAGKISIIKVEEVVKNNEPETTVQYPLDAAKGSLDIASTASEEVKALVIDSKIKLLPDIDQITSIYKEYISHLNVEQLSHLLTIISVILILICTSQIIAVQFGDKFIDYFKLEQKYPRLVKLFSLRKKLNYFNTSINLFIIFSHIYFIYKYLHVILLIQGLCLDSSSAQARPCTRE